jgi:SAM-dependent methyltransferase
MSAPLPPDDGRSGDGPSRYSPAWLTLRETVDAVARASELLDQLPAMQRPVIHDLGCGTGSMGRWLAHRLPGPQRWVLHDQDPDLLRRAAAATGTDSGGGAVTVETRQGDVTQLTDGDLAGASLVTASALLDLLTVEEVNRLAAACIGAGCPALLTLSVVGSVELDPADPLDGEVAAAFNAHQRRTTGGRCLLGPDAVDAAATAFARFGADVQVRPSPWRLGAGEAALTAEWLRGWVGAAWKQCPGLDLSDYLGRRLEAAVAGELRVVVEHADFLAKLR